MKALMIVGGMAHDYKALPAALADRLNARGDVAVEVTDDLTGLDAQSLAPYRVLIFNTCHRPPLTDEFKNAVVQHVKSGKGLVVVHCSLWSYLDWPEWTTMVGGRVETHDKYGTYEVVVLDPTHPTTLGLASRFAVTDEPYLVDQRDPAATVLIATAEPRHDNAGRLRPGPDPQVWVKSYDKGRIFVTTFGHDAAVQESEPFMTLLHGGIRWAGGLMD
jgi:type 1 glutamine amidotransferase